MNPLILITFYLLFSNLQTIKCQMSLNNLNENEAVANWIYCTEQWDCKYQPCHCPFPAIYDPSSEDALNITAQIEKQICINPLQDCGCFFGLCVCAWECGKSRSEMKSSANLA